MLCPGSQNDISVSGNLLFLSTDSSRSDNSCNSAAQPATEKSSWEGMKIFDISDKTNPKYVAAVETACGSHTHTLVPERRNVYIYVSSYSPSATFPDCQPPHDGISVIKVPRNAPEKAAVVDFPVLFPPTAATPARPPTRASPRPPAATTSPSCRRRTWPPAPAWATASCSTSRTRSTRRSSTASRTTSTSRSGTRRPSTSAANKVVFTDELGGGGAATCNEAIGPNRGADGIYDIVGKGDQRKLVFRATTRSRATRPTPRTASPTTAR